MVPQGSNSGVYFQGRYEIQVFDSWDSARGEPKKDPHHSDCGGIYQRWKNNKGFEGRPPKTNACRAPGQWQSFDVIFRAPRFDASGKKIANAVFVKVVHNGIVVHENQEVTGPTRAAAYHDEKPLGPLMFQGDHGPVAYRNIKLQVLKSDLEKQAGKMIPESTFEAFRNYDYGKSRKAIDEFNNKMQTCSRDLWMTCESKLLEILQASGTSYAAKNMICNILRPIGTYQSVPVLAKLLKDKKLSYMARLVLQGHGCPKVEAVFRNALVKASGKIKIGIINSIAERGGCGATKEIAELLGSNDSETVKAALNALGKTGTEEAAKILLNAEVPLKLKAAKKDALLVCKEKLKE